ncbi:MAG: hypothetical protein V4805_17020 [Pseudomonadota bacterium]
MKTIFWIGTIVCAIAANANAASVTFNQPDTAKAEVHDHGNQQSVEVNNSSGTATQKGIRNQQSTKALGSEVKQNQTGSNNTQLIDAEAGKATQNQSGYQNKQVMRVKGATGITQNQSGSFNSQTMDVRTNDSPTPPGVRKRETKVHYENMQQNQSGLMNRQQINLGGSGDDK